MPEMCCAPKPFKRNKSHNLFSSCEDLWIDILFRQGSALFVEYHNQGCRKLFRAERGGNCAKSASRVPEANRGQQGRIADSGGESFKKGILSCYYNSLLISAKSKHKKNWYTFAFLVKGRQGQSPTLVPLSGTLGLIYKFWLRKFLHC